MTWSHLVLAALLSLQADELRVTHTELGFSLVRPSGFVDDAELRGQPNVLYAWYEPREDESGTMVIAVQRLGFVLGRERMTAEDLPEGDMELTTFRWRGFEISGVDAVQEQEGHLVTVFLAQVPLRREAIQLIVSAPIEESERARATMTSMLATLEGETNWLTSEQRAERLGETVGRLILIPIVIGAILWTRKRRAVRARAQAPRSAR